MNSNKKKILFVCPYPIGQAPSQRFRFEQYFTILEKNGYQHKIAPFLNEAAWEVLYHKGAFFRKVLALINGFAKRKLLLLKLREYAFIFIHREATPVGPPFFEWCVKYIWQKKIIYDFDDAIWLDDPQEKGSLKAWIKWKSKVKYICKWSYKVSCGNAFLAKFASEYNKNVIINPTTIDTAYHRASMSAKNGKMPTIGWTGTHSTLIYLQPLLVVLEKVLVQYPFRLRIIANKKPSWHFKTLDFKYWNKNSEIDDLNEIDIGLMPLTEDNWSRGKCGFKALQFMALSIPVVASPVGVNAEIIPNGGYLAKTMEEWEFFLIKLLENESLRNQLGEGGRTFIENNFSVSANTDTFLSLFDKQKEIFI